MSIISIIILYLVIGFVVSVGFYLYDGFGEPDMGYGLLWLFWPALIVVVAALVISYLIGYSVKWVGDFVEWLWRKVHHEK